MTSDSEAELDFELRYLRAPMIAFRIRLFLAGVLFPIGCFLAAAADYSVTADTPWQSGKTAHYVAMLLSWPGNSPFLPLVMFSQICMAAWLVVPDSGRRMIVRLGIYSGLVMSLQFLLFVLMTSTIMTFVVAAFVGPIVALIVAACVRIPIHVRQFAIRHVMILTALVALIISAARLLGISLIAWSAILLYLTFYVLMATPVLCAIAYTRATIQVAVQAEPTQNQWHWPAAAISWIISWTTAWKFAVDIMLVEYSKLPTTDPNCYVSTAAAHGHRELVGTRNYPHGVQPINLQVRRLKFLEIVLRAASPKTHGRVRRIYDRIGPGLAKQCRRSVWFADATYLMLKPIEWVSELARITLRIQQSSIQRLYYGQSDDQSMA